MINSSMAIAMRLHIANETQRLFPPAQFQSQPMNDAAIYEAYIYTCVVEAVELLRYKYPRAGITWELISPPLTPNQLVLRKKACSIASAMGRYSYVRISVGAEEYELHTDVPVQGQSGVVSELDVVLLKAEVCHAIRRGEQQTPLSQDVLLLIEAKCYSTTLHLSIGREFLGLHNTEFKGKPIGRLVSTAANERVRIMLGYHGKRQQRFWSSLDDLAARRQAFVDDLTIQLRDALVAPRSAASRRPRARRPPGIIQPPLPYCS